MKRIFILIASVVFVISCSHGKTGNFPTVENPSEAAKVYVIRDNNLFGWGFSLKVVLDKAVIARLRAGEYVSFYVKPGFHSLGISDPTLSVPFEKGRTYYFLISADYSSFGFELQRIGDEKGQHWVARTKPIK